MRKNFFLLLSLVIAFNASSQSGKKLTDTSFALGVVTKDLRPTTKDGKILTISERTQVILFDITTIGSKKRGYVVAYGKHRFTLSDDEVKFLPTDAYDQLLDFTPDQIKTFQNTAERYGWAVFDLDLQAIKKFFDKQSTIGLTLDDWSFYDESEYTEGTSLSFSISNLSKKTIKYVWFTVTAKNPVKDIISTKTVKGVGPVEPKSSASWSFDYAWFTDLVHYVNIRSIKVQYMDGSYKTFTNIESLFVPDRFKSILDNVDDD